MMKGKFTLYICVDRDPVRTATSSCISEIRKLLDRYSTRIDLTIVEVCSEAERTETANIIATPTLVAEVAGERHVFVGDDCVDGAKKALRWTGIMD